MSEPRTEAGRAHLKWLLAGDDVFEEDARAAVLAIEAEATARPSDDLTGSWRVHNHGTETGLGTACPEYHLNGRLVGSCLLDAARPSDDLTGLREGLRAVLSDFDRQPTDEYLDEAERIFRAARLEPGA